MLTVPKSTFPCPHCFKVYRRKREFELHRATCSILNNHNHNEKLVENQNYEFDVCGITEKDVEVRQDTNMMSYAQMCDIIKMLVVEQNKLKGQVKTLQQQLASVRKKVSAEEYLAQCVKPAEDINNFSQKLVIDNTEFSELVENKLEAALDSLIIRVMNTTTIDNIPIRTFTAHTGNVYCYEHVSNEWRKMTDDDWNTIVGVVKQSMMDRLQEWSDANERKMSEDTFSLRYNTYIQKIMHCMTRIQPKLITLVCQRVRVSLS